MDADILDKSYNTIYEFNSQIQENQSFLTIVKL